MQPLPPPHGFVGGWRGRQEHGALRCAPPASGETFWGAVGCPPPHQSGLCGCLSMWGWLPCGCSHAELPLPLCSPHRRVWAGAGGGCGAAAPEEMGRESPGGGKPLQKYSRLHPELQEAPASPAPAAPRRLALGWLGLTGSRKGPRAPGAMGGPAACQETPRNGHRSSPCSWHRPRSALPVPCCCLGLRSPPKTPAQASGAATGARGQPPVPCDQHRPTPSPIPPRRGCQLRSCTAKCAG